MKHCIKPQTPSVYTSEASTLGTGAMSVNGRVHPHGQYTTYYFEYGTTADYSHRTKTFDIPPRLEAYYRESWDENFGGWSAHSGCNKRHFASGGVSKGYVRFTEQPVVSDFNHDGSGALHLMTGIDTGPIESKGSQSVHLGGDDADLRGATIRIWMRGRNWKPNGSEYLFWVQSQSNIEVLNKSSWKRANWAYTGHYLTDYLLDGEWHNVQLDLVNDTTLWNFGGNNPIQQGPSAVRYEYWPIDQALGHNNINLLLLSAFVDPENPPTGSIDFDEVEIIYRNRSLLFPGNGGKLLNSPKNSMENPATLTDGWRNGQGHTWKSGKNPSQPLEFIYSFDNLVTIEIVQLHQNPDWPVKNVEVLVSMDGKTFSPILKRKLPENGVPNANFAFVIDRGLSVKALYLKVRLLSGYKRLHWGLGEIEIFGTGAKMLPDDSLYHVNTDIKGLAHGEIYHYRLVATNASGTNYGDDQIFTMPNTTKPQVETGERSRVTTRTVKVEGRINPMGHPTYYFFEYGKDTNYNDGPFNNATIALVEINRPLRKSPEVVQLPVPGTFAGTQITPRTVNSNLTGLNPGTTYHYRLVGVNQMGVSYGNDATFETKE